MAEAAQGPALTKNQYAYREVRRRILMAELAPGEPIPQARLATELGVSLTPLREALRKLDAEGLVTFASHRDVRPTPLTSQGAQDLFEVRRFLEPMGNRLGAERRDAADIERIGQACVALQPLTGVSSLPAMIAHRDLHRALYGASHNEELIDVLDGLWDKADRYRHFVLHTDADDPAARIARVRKEHEALATAVIDGDVEAAERITRTHIDKSLARLAAAQLG